jgi:hypothetical protein
MNFRIIGAMMASAILVTARGGPIVEALTVEQAISRRRRLSSEHDRRSEMDWCRAKDPRSRT